MQPIFRCLVLDLFNQPINLFGGIVSLFTQQLAESGENIKGFEILVLSIEDDQARQTGYA